MPDSIDVLDAAGTTRSVATLDALIARVGEVGASPTANTLQARLKTIGDKDFATQTTLAALLAKVSADPATQTTLAAVLAKISADPATNTTLSSVLSALSTIAGLLAGTLGVTGTVAIAGTPSVNTGLTQALTDAQLRAAAVPVSGPITDAQLRASAVPVSLSDAATATNQTALNALITTIDTVLDAILVKLADPATAAKQDTLIGHLNTLQGVVSSARAAVNLIAGQAGITAGAGAVAANTPRMTLASDDPAVAHLNTLQGIITAARAAVNLISGQAGVSGNSGAVDAATLRAVLATDQPRVSVAMDTTTIKENGANLTPKFAAIAARTSGNNTLVAAVTSKKIRVLQLSLMGNGAVNAKFQSGAGGTDLTGLYYVDAVGGGFILPFSPTGWFETAANTLLNLNLSAAVAVGGCLQYVEVA